MKFNIIDRNIAALILLFSVALPRPAHAGILLLGGGVAAMASEKDRDTTLLSGFGLMVIIAAFGVGSAGSLHGGNLALIFLEKGSTSLEKAYPDIESPAIYSELLNEIRAEAPKAESLGEGMFYIRLDETKVSTILEPTGLPEVRINEIAKELN